MAGAGPELELLLRPLGLSNRRAERIRAISGKWEYRITIDTLPGVGPYAIESVNVFCRGHVPPVADIGDQKVAAWVAWKIRQKGQVEIW
jgi:hypothetical protein